MKSSGLTKTIAILLFLVLTVSLIACSSGTPSQEPAPDAGSSPATDSSSSSSTVDETPTEDEETDTPDDPYAERVSATVTSTSNFSETEGDPVYEFISEKFNIDITHYPVTFDNWNERNRMWISAGDMPDEIMWNFEYTSSYSEYANYVEQGLLRALPDNWKDTYTELVGTIAASKVEDYITIDGKLYMIPHTVFYRYAPVEIPYAHESAMIRKDWADKLGMSFDTVITLDEMVEFIKGSKENDFDGIGSDRITGFTSNIEMTVQTFVAMHNPGFDMFYKKDGNYVWGPEQPETLEGIMNLKGYYDMGVIDPDFYLDNSREHWNKMAAGTAAMMFGEGSMGNLRGRIQEFAAQHPDKNAYECIQMLTLVGHNDEYWGDSWANYWSATLFSPNSDQAVFERLLAIHDYGASAEGQEISQMGIEGVHWKRSGEGYEILRDRDEFGNFDTLRNMGVFFTGWLGISALCGDDFNFVDASMPESVTEQTVAMYKQKAAHDRNGQIIHFNPEYIFFKSDSKDQYSSKPWDEITRLVITPGVNIEAEWNAWIESQRPVFQPVLDDLNAVYGS